MCELMLRMKSNEEKEDNKKTNVFRVPGNDFVGIFMRFYKKFRLFKVVRISNEWEGIS